jgi:transketolase
MDEICLRDKIGEFLCDFAKNDSRIYCLDSDLAKSLKTVKFAEEFPERFIETGIAEASAMSIATGLAAEGQIPFYVNFAIFVAGTAWTQLRQAAYANLNVKMIGSYAGMDNAKDGASHHANEDLALVR